jgi:hypothetical protein
MPDTVKRPARGHARYGAMGAASKAQKAHSFNNAHKIDFKEINEAALNALPTLLARWLPAGKRIGKEYVALNPTRADRHLGSFKVVIVGYRAGVSARAKWPRRRGRLDSKTLEKIRHCEVGGELVMPSPKSEAAS